MVHRQKRILLLIAAPLLFAANAQAEEKEPSAIVEIGGAGEWGLPGSSSFGPSAAVEFTPHQELAGNRGGVSTLFGGGKTEWSTDLLFKKPFTLSDQVEFMIGVGPERFRETGRKLLARSRPISCSGRRRIESTAGLRNRTTASLSAKGMNNCLA